MPLDIRALTEQSRAVMTAAMWDYVTAGSWDSVTADEAARAWRRYRFRPRLLHDVEHVSVAATLLGRRTSGPIGIAPTSLQRLAHPEGEVAMAAGAAAADCVHVVSSNAGHPFAEIGNKAHDWWLQLYLPPDRDSVLPVVEIAAAAGARALVLTLDTPEPGPKPAAEDAAWAGVDRSWFRCNFADPDQARWAADIRAEDIGWLARRTGLPVVAKGVVRGEDALRCADAGASAVWVSNHGGRQLDRTVPTAIALPDVVRTVGDRAEVYVDGGIGSGLDVLTALALGARAVFVGRLPLHALAAGGAEGVTRLITSLTADTRLAMRLAGVASLQEIGTDLVAHARTW